MLLALASLFIEGGESHLSPARVVPSSSNSPFQRSPISAVGAGRGDIPVRSHMVGAVDVWSWGGASLRRGLSRCGPQEGTRCFQSWGDEGSPKRGPQAPKPCD